MNAVQFLEMLAEEILISDPYIKGDEKRASLVYDDISPLNMKVTIRAFHSMVSTEDATVHMDVYIPDTDEVDINLGVVTNPETVYEIVQSMPYNWGITPDGGGRWWVVFEFPENEIHPSHNEVIVSAGDIEYTNENISGNIEEIASTISYYIDATAEEHYQIMEDMESDALSIIREYGR